MAEALEISALCKKYQVPFFINDNVDIAIQCKADGVHVGQEDMEVSQVRKKVGDQMMIGVSVHSVEEAIRAVENGADCLGGGAMFHTSTKECTGVLPKERLRDICAAVKVPVVAIGGIKKSNIEQLAVKTLSLYQAAYYFQKEYDVALSADEIVDGINKTIEHFNVYEVLPKPGVCEFLDKMKQLKIPMCVATAIERSQVIAALKRCKMEQYFDEVFTSIEVGSGKDEPMIYRKAMEYFDADYSTSLVFEDALYAVQTAKKRWFPSGCSI